MLFLLGLLILGIVWVASALIDNDATSMESLYGEGLRSSWAVFWVRCGSAPVQGFGVQGLPSHIQNKIERFYATVCMREVHAGTLGQTVTTLTVKMRFFFFFDCPPIYVLSR